MCTARACSRANTEVAEAPTANLPDPGLLLQELTCGRLFHLSAAHVFLPFLSASFEATFPGHASPSLFFLRVR
jgi:hypothetical protein